MGRRRGGGGEGETETETEDSSSSCWQADFYYQTPTAAAPAKC